MTSLPHVFLCVEVDFSGKIVKGISSEGLPPKWFTKNPDTTFEEGVSRSPQKSISFMHSFSSSLTNDMELKPISILLADVLLPIPNTPRPRAPSNLS